ncbi:MAG: efflux RND transporter permease subunit [Pseudomonadales bacterium]|nr:efflux RND transporter permease subunit [Pseudomonadales bacterium]
MAGSQTLIDLFVRHRVAPNLVMIMMILSGVWAANQINLQLDPSVEFPVVTIRATWPGASAEDVEQLIVAPIEQQLANTVDLSSMRSTSSTGAAQIRLEFVFDTDMTRALDTVKDRVAQVRNFPPDMEPIVVSRAIDYEFIATMAVSADGSLAELVPLVKSMERDLYSRGIERIDFDGLPEEEIAIQVGSATLVELQTSLDRIAGEVRSRSLDAPAGTVGRGQGEMQLRALDQRRAVPEFDNLEVALQPDGRLVRLGDIAEIDRRAKAGQAKLTRNGKTTIEMDLYRLTSSDALMAARILDQWQQDIQTDLPAGVEVNVYQESWTLLRDQLQVIWENGLSGLVLVVVTLLLFLNGRVGWWVMVGIPVSFLFATLIYYGVFAGSINVLALITFIMALGIVVDDAIVVSEDAVTLYQQGLSPTDAAAGGAKRMLVPVLTSSLTTMAAFVPLLITGGEMGAIIMTLPMVLLCVILASLVECFFVLPGHLKHSLEKMSRQNPDSFRSRFDRKFFQFRDRYYRPLLDRALAAPGTTLCLAIGCVIIALSLLISGRVGLNMVTGVSPEMLEANVRFSAQASVENRDRFMAFLEQTMNATDKELGGVNVTGFITKFNSAQLNQERQTGNQFASLRLEYAWEETRLASPQEFVNRWREKVSRPPYVEELYLEVTGGANNGRPDISLVLRGRDVPTLKQASEELQAALGSYPGVSNVYDNLPYGKDQVVYSLNPVGKSLGISTESLGRQLRAAYNGQRVQVFNQNDTEVEVSVTLPDVERDHMVSLKQLPIITPDGDMVALGMIADLRNRSGIDVINHSDGFMSVVVSATVDPRQNNADQIVTHISNNALAEIRDRYNLTSALDGVTLQNQQILDTMKLGALLTVIFIYLILVWSFASYTWPLAVMTAIPLGLTGAVIGHLVMGYDLGAMSLLAFFSLTGIVVNDSIILVSFFRRGLDEGLSVNDAIHQASLSRFRAVLLTSLTTIAGLGPLMFETFSLALYMVPIAITLCFGLAFSTLLVLLVIPALIVMIEDSHQTLRSKVQERLTRLTGVTSSGRANAGP